MPVPAEQISQIFKIMPVRRTAMQQHKGRSFIWPFCIVDAYRACLESFFDELLTHSHVLVILWHLFNFSITGLQSSRPTACVTRLGWGEKCLEAENCEGTEKSLITAQTPSRPLNAVLARFRAIRLVVQN